ncbi:hypothetical protein, partial [Butyrivibrio sp.]|uniref:hypothetical protein n=1 Tax=Butyrivibrio sp. TaxID=28121 RepID=UPI0025BC0865
MQIRTKKAKSPPANNENVQSAIKMSLVHFCCELLIRSTNAQGKKMQKKTWLFSRGREQPCFSFARQSPEAACLWPNEVLLGDTLYWVIICR